MQHSIAAPAANTVDLAVEVDRLSRSLQVEAVELLHGGAILAVKGLGGYHLACDAANEQAVHAFHAGRIGFLDIVGTVARVVDAHEQGDASLAGVLDAERWARARADELIGA